MEQIKEVFVSVIVPVYNVENYLCEFIDSVLQQSLTNLELILIDDGSTDSSAAICDKYALNDSRIKVVHKENGGVASARNYGLSISEGKWVIFCDSDDYLEPLGIESLYTKGESENADVVFGDINLIKGGKKQPVQFYKTEFSTNDKALINNLIKADFSRKYCFDPPDSGPAFGYGGPWNKLVKRKFLLNYSINFNEELKGIFDDILYTAYIFACAQKVVYIHDIVYNYRLLNNSITKAYKENLPEINSAIFCAWREFLNDYDKDGEFEQTYYIIVIRRFSYLFGQYFFNKKNNKTLKEQLNELRIILTSEPYFTALKKADKKKIHTRKDSLFFHASRLKSPYILFITYKLYTFVKILLGRIMVPNSIKKFIKLILGQKGLLFVKKMRGEAEYLKTNIIHKIPRIFMNECEWNSPIIIEKKEKNVFFGYYDIQQVNKDNTKLLVTEVDKHASPSKDSATLEWYDLNTNEFHFISETSAWCWQQGARLRWHPVNDQIVIFNDVERGTYVAKYYDIANQREVDALPCALYDITPDGKYGFSLNYSRLQHLRPGYGYDRLPDKAAGIKVPENDGIFRINCKTKKQDLIVSYQQLADMTPEARDKWNYINHISVSPGGSKLMFFYIWTDSPYADWKLKLFVSNLNGKELKCLESDLIVSHYAWRNDDELLVVTASRNGECSRYCMYNVNTADKFFLNSDKLKENGHPSFMPNKNEFISDTYPSKDFIQHLFEGQIKSESTRPICNLYSDPRLFGEKRCDLHPRVSSDGSILTVDSTFQDGKRCVLVFSKIN